MIYPKYKYPQLPLTDGLREHIAATYGEPLCQQLYAEGEAEADRLYADALTGLREVVAALPEPNPDSVRHTEPPRPARQIHVVRMGAFMPTTHVVQLRVGDGLTLTRGLVQSIVLPAHVFDACLAARTYEEKRHLQVAELRRSIRRVLNACESTDKLFQFWPELATTVNVWRMYAEETCTHEDKEKVLRALASARSSGAA